MTRYSRRELEIADHLWECLVRIAEDNGTDPQVVLNQAVYDLARRFNFLTPVAGQSVKKHPSSPALPPAAKEPAPKKSVAAAPAPKGGAAAPAKNALCVVNGQGEMQKVEKDPFIIGRSRTCDLVIPSSKVSRQHCRVSRENGDYFIEDLGSPNGVWRDGVKITKEKIKDGDEFMLSDEVVKFVFKAPARK
jgi:hypothetical protein